MVWPFLFHRNSTVLWQVLGRAFDGLWLYARKFLRIRNRAIVCLDCDRSHEGHSWDVENPTLELILIKTSRIKIRVSERITISQEFSVVFGIPDDPWWCFDCKSMNMNQPLDRPGVISWWTSAMVHPLRFGTSLAKWLPRYSLGIHTWNESTTFFVVWFCHVQFTHSFAISLQSLKSTSSMF